MTGAKPLAEQHAPFDRAVLARRRQRAAARARNHDFLLRRVAEDFAARLAIVQRQFDLAVNLGAHHGVLGELADLTNVGRMIHVDGVAEMLAQCPGEGIVADEEALPFADETIDLVVSGLALQWVNDLPGVLAQIRRALKPDGLLLAALIGGGSLVELRQAFIEAEEEVTGGASPRVAPFVDVRDLGGLAQRAGFALPVVDRDAITLTYPSALALMVDLKAMGASNALSQRRRVPVTRGVLARAAAIYETRFGMGDGRVAASIEILTLTAWAPHESQQKPLARGSAQMRLADALGVKEERGE
ncbi:MAG: methyltransferase domain-containing protein [Hyphomicrobiaceae bacterium]|nr:methyltransferase domain-containing protein [Hyphomicrobiaceae bacterium]